MKLQNKIMSLVFISMLFSCADNESLTDKELSLKIEETSKAIISMTSDLSCDSDQQCGAIKYGSKPCGGPETYKLYSTKNTDLTVLTELTEEYFDLTKEYNERNNATSDCAFVSDPAVMCNEFCQVKE